jgi:cellulose synthase/poly-beta-1,6-N-acetylglucosamine synthase-like glycosyltransferase
MTLTALLVFWGCLLALAVAYLFYPLGLLGLARLRKRPAHGGEGLPTVTLVIPAHNEEKVLEGKLRNALAVDYPRAKLEIVVASDGSRDRTAEIARGFADRGVRLLDFPRRRGKASVLNDAAAAAGGELLCLCDANVMFRPDALATLVRPFADPAVGAVSGDVRLASHESDFGEGESLYYRLERAVQLAESRLGSLMGVDGGMYLLRGALFRPLPPDTILDDFVISMRVLRAGGRVLYEPRAVATENGTPTARQEFRRRVRVSAGAVQSLKRREWPPLNRPLELGQYFCHKVLRWASPPLLLLLLLANVLLVGQGLGFRLALATQGAVYLLAAGASLSVRFRRTALGGVPFYFVMSHVAMGVGLVKGLFNRQPVTWAQADRAAAPAPVLTPTAG